MFNLRNILRRLANALAVPATPSHPDAMSLRDWADLPPHHPRSDGSSC